MKLVIAELRLEGGGERFLVEVFNEATPKAKTVREIAATGLAIIEKCKNAHLFEVASEAGIFSPDDSSIEGETKAAIKRYIEPFLTYVVRQLPNEPEPAMQDAPGPSIPVAIQESLAAFRSEYPDSRKVAFVIMQFGQTNAHEKIEQGIKQALAKHGLTALLARDKEYHDDLYPNIQTFMHGCAFGIAVFERIERDNFNPNVSLEAGYMMGLKKPVLLLKDKTLSALQTDLVGKLYKPFDPQDPVKSIGPELEKWMEDKGFI